MDYEFDRPKEIVFRHRMHENSYIIENRAANSRKIGTYPDNRYSNNKCSIMLSLDNV